MNWCNKSDGELVAAFISSGAQAAFSELVSRHASMVFRTCRRVTTNHQDAEDATQAVFATLVVRAAELTSYPSLGGWLYSTAWRVSRRYRRALLARRRHEHRAQPVIPIDGDDRANGVDPGDTMDEVYRAIEMLPPDYREAVVLHHLEGFTVRELAEVTGCSVGTAAARLSRARALMRERLSWRGIVVTDAMIAAYVLEDALLPVPASVSASASASAPALAAGQAATAGAMAIAGGAIAPVTVAGASGAGLSSAATYGAMLLAGVPLAKWAAVACVAVAVGGSAAAAVIHWDSAQISRMRLTGSATQTRSSAAAALDDDNIHSSGRSRSTVGSSSSNSHVPEPSCLGLLALGGLLFRRHRRPAAD